MCGMRMLRDEENGDSQTQAPPHRTMMFGAGEYVLYAIARWLLPHARGGAFYIDYINGLEKLGDYILNVVQSKARQTRA